VYLFVYFLRDSVYLYTRLYIWSGVKASIKSTLICYRCYLYLSLYACKLTYTYPSQWLHDDFDAAEADAPAAEPMPDPIADAVPTWSDVVYPPDGEKPPDIILGELLLMYFEWMNTHKVTDACAKAAYTLLTTLLPADANSGNWATARKMLKAIYEQTVQAIELCPNDCIAYYDCKHPSMKHYKHARRTSCPTCGADRHLTDKDGATRAAKTGYYLPCGTWFRDLFKVEGLGEHLSQHAASSRPPGHASRSRGWHKKVSAVYI
jgi:hypothetical protein